jgi:hypothetical protein
VRSLASLACHPAPFGRFWAHVLPIFSLVLLTSPHFPGFSNYRWIPVTFLDLGLIFDENSADQMPPPGAVGKKQTRVPSQAINKIIYDRTFLSEIGLGERTI